MSASLSEQWLKQANSPRRRTEPRVPPDEIDGRATTLWFETPFADCDPAWLASWPERRREIVRESHEPVMQSFARYGALP
jgi:hypothetical protein